MDLWMLLGLLILLCAFWWGGREIARVYAIPAQIVVPVSVLLVLFVLVWILSALGMMPSLPRIARMS